MSVLHDIINVLRQLRQLQGHLASRSDSLQIANDQIKINQGKILAELYRVRNSGNLNDDEFTVFSQWGEDGLIQRLIREVEIENRTFIEFGVEDFLESNCRYLMVKDNWKGFVIDGSTEKIARLQHSELYWKYQLEAVASFITRENINDLLRRSGFSSDLGILSIDLDGVDYWILEAIEFFSPRILIVEYNAVFGFTRKITVPYQADFFRTQQHFSNLYYGASLPALAYLAEKKGYSLVATTHSGGNAFFVRNDLMSPRLKPITAQEGHVSTSREGRDPEGNLTFVGGEARLELIRGLPVINVETGAREGL